MALFFITALPLPAQNEKPVFKQLNVEDGLSNNWVKAIIKDQSGFMWFGTFNGLNRYDGKTFKVFQVDEKNNLNDNLIESMMEDAQGNIWVGTFSGGLNRFDRKTETFTHFQHQPKVPSSISGNRINAIYQDKQGNLWIGTNKGLDLFDYATQTFRYFKHNPANPASISDDFVSSIFQDSKGILWVGTQNGLNYYIPSTDNFFRYQHHEIDLNSLAHGYVKSIYEDKSGNLWIGTWGGGLDKLNPARKGFQHFQHQPGKRESLSNNSVLCVSGNEDNQIYIATEGGGLNILDLQKEQFTHFIPDFTDPRSINSNSLHALFYDHENGFLWMGSYNGGLNYFSKWDKPFNLYQAKLNGLNNNHITCLTEDKNGNLWIGTDGGGLNVFNERTGEFSYYTKEQGNGLQNNAILSLLCDSKNNIWVGTYNGGLDLIGPDRLKITKFRNNPNNRTSLSGENINAIYEDKEGKIWVGTMTGGLNLYTGEKNGFIHYEHNPSDKTSLIDNFIYKIFEDRTGRLLILTGKGIAIFDRKNGSFKPFPQSVSTNFDVPVTIMEDSQGNLWIGSQSKGLFRVDRTGVKVNNYTEKDGLPSNSISGILEDDLGNLWISTHKGLCKFEEAVVKPEKIRFHIYSVEDGLQGSEFKTGAFCKKKDGRMVFGGQQGFNIFDPRKINNNPFVPPVKITGFKLFNEDVNFTTSGILNAPVSETETITLTHDQSVFTFYFSSLNYMLPEKNQYAYLLEGFNDKWIYAGRQNNATYTNLDAGDYIFKVKSTNNDGIWNEEGTQIKITILPPWWENNYFRSGLILLFFSSIFTYYKFRTYQLKKSKKELTRQVEVRTAEIRRMADKIKDLNEAKTKFFTNISHELRTPLNLILWPLEELLNNTKQEPGLLAGKYHLMHKNATKLIKLINQLLDFRKIETGTIELNLTSQNIIPVIREIFDDFQEWADRKQIQYTLESKIPELMMSFDADKLEKILSNLLSNAFKFVEKGGKIMVLIDHTEPTKTDAAQLRIEVRDNGKGIPASQLDLVFNRFYKSKAPKFPGSGIGLSLAKELTALHEGKIWVKSREHNGASFFVQIPVNLKNADQTNLVKSIITESAPIQNVSLLEGSDIPKRRSSNAPSILLVEDNKDILEFMCQKLNAVYHILTAHDGMEALTIAMEQVPDLIVSDVMMPEMDGFEMCKKLKKDERTSHIPIILITARPGEESQLHGLDIGADDYLTKPFHFELLQLKIKNILYTRQKLKDQLLQNVLVLPDDSNMNSVDQQFLQNAIYAVKENIENSAFGVEEFSNYFKMSRRNVLRKMKGITGLSINEYIRVVRLKESHNLLLQGNLNVSEVAYSVGFTDPKYFSNCFKKQFGKSPSDIIGNK